MESLEIGAGVMYDAIIVGCGFAGSIIARFLAEKLNKKVLILEKRNHIAGNMYDFVDENNILVQKYGPHTFHTNNKSVFDYLCRYSEWFEYKVECMVYMNGKFTPSPFNLKTIDDYFERGKAKLIKQRIKEKYGELDKTNIVEMLESDDELIKEYADFLYENDYSLYTAKQWGISPSEIDVSVLKRVPVLFTYKTGYFDDKYQYQPKNGFARLFENILNHKNIDIKLNYDANKHISVDITKKIVLFDGQKLKIPLIYTGAVDELLNYKYGLLPYRSLRFEFKTENTKSYQDAPIVAYPQEKGFTRITEYTKLPYQSSEFTKVAFEYPLQYEKDENIEPYYPILTEKNIEQYNKYKSELNNIDNLFLCGRLADFKYYNMDKVIERAFEVCEKLEKELN